MVIDTHREKYYRVIKTTQRLRCLESEGGGAKRHMNNMTIERVTL